MSIFKRAFLYIMRKKVRSIILFILFFIMALFLLVGVSVYSSARKEAENVKKSMPAGINIERVFIERTDVMDLEEMETGEVKRILKLPLLTESTFQKMLEIDGITGYFEESDIWQLYTGLKLHPGMHMRCIEEIEAKDPEIVTDQEKEFYKLDKIEKYANGFYPVIEGKDHPFFMNGAIEISQGRNIEKGDKGKIVISEELAENNQLKIGDKIQVSVFDLVKGNLYGKPKDIEIIGIFHMNYEEKIGELTYEAQILSNLIFTDEDLVEWHTNEWKKYYNEPAFVPWEDAPVSGRTLQVENPEKLDSIEEKIRAIGDKSNVDWKYYNIRHYDKDYKAVAKPLLLMVKLSVVLMVMMGVGAMIILSLVLSMWIQSRKREIRILSLIGVKKKSIVAQLVLECSILAIAAFVLAGILADPVTNMTGETWSKLVSKNQSEQPYESVINDRFEVEVHRTANEPVKLHYNLTLQSVILVFAIMLFVNVSAVIISYVRIGGYRARKIGL